MTCLGCKFWRDITGGDRLQGECRRFPPVGGEANFAPNGAPRWPITTYYGWCGEFKATPKRKGRAHD